MSSPQAGWHPDPDPTNAGGQRYWDGTGWTDHQTRAPVQPPPDLSRPPIQPRHQAATAWWKRTWVVAIAAGLVGIGIGAAAGSSGSGSKKQSDSAAAAPATTTTTKTVTAAAAPAVTVTTTATVTAKPPAPATTKPAGPLLQLSGSGTKNSAPFTVTADHWTIAWTYDCGGDDGNFIVNYDGDDANIAVNELGPRGKDSTIEYGSGTFQLGVISTCNWTVTVTQ
jgi:hypothetical protein